MSSINECKKGLIFKLKDVSEELKDLTYENLDNNELLNAAWQELESKIENLPNINIKYIITHINDFTDDIGITFEFVGIIKKENFYQYQVPNFYYLENEICFLSDLTSQSEINNDVITSLILNHIEKISNMEEDEVLVFYKKDTNNSNCFKNKIALLNTLLFNLGISLNNEIITTRKNFLEPINNISNKNFHQYQESIEIYNEYLNTKDILWKFLLLYHILENFSYRQSISKTLRNSLSLNTRHLGKVYTSSRAEGEFITKAIKEFLNNIVDQDFFTDTDSILKLNSINNVKVLILDKCDDIVKNICIFLDKELKDIDNKKVSDKEFSNIVYMIRNCVVHNKETEWIHINSSLLKSKPDVKKFFELFLLPTMELIVRELILKENTIIDYPIDKPNYLLLWGDSPTSTQVV